MLSLTTSPITTAGGINYNIFAAYRPIVFEFERQDFELLTVTNTINNKCAVLINDEVGHFIDVNESIYIYSVGINYTYSTVCKVTAINEFVGTTELITDLDFVAVGYAGYANIYQNYYVEFKLTDVYSGLDLLSYTAQIPTKPNGEIEFDASVIATKLQTELPTTSGQMTNSHYCKLNYREIYREQPTIAYTVHTENFVCISAITDDMPTEDFSAIQTIPKTWKGYPFFYSFIHSPENNESGKKPVMYYDELDLNQLDITIDNLFYSFTTRNYGVLVASKGLKEAGFDPDTKYLKIRVEYEASADFLRADFLAADFLTA